MKKLWLNSRAEVEQELTGLITNRIPVVLSRADFSPQTVLAMVLRKKTNFSLLQFKKTAEFAPPESECFFFYRPFSHLTRLFQGVPMNDQGKSFEIIIPAAIFQIQRRKHPRLTTPAPSHALFTTVGSTRVNKGVIKDISLEGAFLGGCFSGGVKEGSEIGHLTLVLCMNSRHIDPCEVQIHRARVVRLIKTENGGGIGINFQVSGSERILLENYFNLRMLEERGAGREQKAPRHWSSKSS